MAHETVIRSSLILNDVQNSTAPATNFLVLSGATDLVTTRTAAQMLNDIFPLSGSTNQVAYWNSSSGITGDNNFWWNNSSQRLGIGTSSPNQTLEVAGTMRLTGSIGTGTTLMARDANGDVSAISVGSGLSLSANTLTSTGGGGGGISGTGTTNYIPKWDSGTSLADSVIFQSGTSVGIGTTTLSSDRLDIQGTTASQGGQIGAELMTTGSGTNWTGISFASGYTHTTGNTAALTSTISVSNASYYQVNYTVSGRTFGTVNVSVGGVTSGNVSASGSLAQSVTSATAVTVTPSPDFDGAIILSVKRITASTMATFALKNSSGTVVYEQRAGASNTNIFQGVGAGRLNTTGTVNHFQGYQAGYSNTTGTVNHFQGYQAGYSNTTGTVNHFQGYQAGYANTTGTENAFFGPSAGGANTTGSRNTMIGYNTGVNASNLTGNLFIGNTSGRYISSGTYNVFMGTDAGRVYGPGGGTSLASLTQGILIGFDARPLANGETNATVIGSQGRGLGSNTTVIGNSSTIQTWLGGKVSVGTTGNTAYLNVQGSGTTSATTSLLIQNSATTPLLTIKDDGQASFNNWLGVGTAVMSADRLDIQGTTASEGGQIGAELMTTGSGTNWTGTSFASGYTHTTGNTTALTSTISVSNASYYQVNYTVSGRTFGTVNVSVGGVTSGNVSASGSLAQSVTSATPVTVTPSPDFDGAIILSVKRITPSTMATFALKNSSGTVVYEQRASASNTNVFQGVGAGRLNTTGINNVLQGYLAGYSNTTGQYNVFIGPEAGQANTTASQNVFIGRAGLANTTGGDNFFLGFNAGLSNSTGQSNVFIGSSSGRLSTGSENVFIGSANAFTLASGTSNTFVGSTSGRGLTSGSSNTLIGKDAGRYYGTGTSTTLTMSQGTLCGFDARTLGDGEIGVIVMGAASRGLGSNTTVIGSSATTRAKLWGSLENQSASASNANTSLLIQNSATRALLTVKDGGVIEIGANVTVTGNTTATIQATDSATNVGIALAPKGSGAFTLSIPDGTSAGGNPRGTYAVDLQRDRNGSSQVASGNYSIIGGGSHNSVLSSYSIVAGGNSNTIVNSNSVISGGFNNLNSNIGSVIAGGESNNTYGKYASIVGGSYGSAYLYGQTARASGGFVNIGDAQKSELILRRSITGTGSTELYLDGENVQAILPAGVQGTIWNAKIQLAAVIQTSGTSSSVTVGDSFISEHTVGIKRVGNTCVLIGGGVVQNLVSKDTSMDTATVTIAANNTTDALTIFFTPPTTAVATTVTRVVATIYLTEIGF